MTVFKKRNHKCCCIAYKSIFLFVLSFVMNGLVFRVMMNRVSYSFMMNGMSFGLMMNSLIFRIVMNGLVNRFPIVSMFAGFVGLLTGFVGFGIGGRRFFVRIGGRLIDLGRLVNRRRFRKLCG